MVRRLALLVLVLGALWAAAEVPTGQALANYSFGLLRRGPAWTPGRSPAIDSLQAGHMENIGRMWDEGVLVAAGPLLDGGALRGVFVFRADSAGPLPARCWTAARCAASSSSGPTPPPACAHGWSAIR